MQSVALNAQSNFTSERVKMSTGVLLVNLGTPTAPTPSAVRRFLRKFLADKRVVDLPSFIWLPILYGFVLPFRPYKVCKAYQAIWHKQGSPMQVIGEQQAKRLQRVFKDNEYGFDVQLAMTYGEPSIEQQLQYFADKKYEQVVILPLYPQYSTSTTGSVADRVFRFYQSQLYVPSIRMLADYHNHPAYIDALMKSVRHYWQENEQPEKLMLSFHGTPQKLVEQGDPYYEQCRTTAKLLVDALGLTETEYQLCFQSRFGAAPWLQPYTDKVLTTWAEQGVKSVDVICPGFSADCLETLEEVAMGYRDLFIEKGGEQFRYIPALNAEDIHIDCLFNVITEQAGQ